MMIENEENGYNMDQCDQGLVMSFQIGSITEKDILDLLKFAYILKATNLCNGELSRVPQPIHQLWNELRASLCSSPPLAKCNDTTTKAKTSLPEKHGFYNSITHGREGHAEPSSSPSSSSSSSSFAIKAVGNRPQPKEPCSIESQLKDNLVELAESEILQGILPYILSVKTPPSNRGGFTFGENDSLKVSNRGFLHPLRRKSISESNLHKLISSDLTMSSQEITIHVCDDSRDAKRDFTCPQDLLTSNMGYFNDITSGQNLEDVDISVHCDIYIFEWLMAWIQRGNSTGDPPCFEPGNVMSILVSASFLKMDQLVDDALQFIHKNMNKVLGVTYNMNCLSDALLQRLSSFYSPSQVEDIIDRRDRIQSKLFIKLIFSLCEPDPQPDRELFESAASLHRCRLCGLFLTNNLAKLLPCLPLRSSINLRGQIVPKHQRDPHFNINDLIRGLRTELKSWRKVFWRLWGMVHTLPCSLCSSSFPLYLNEFCSYHPHDPEFPAIQFKNSTQPFGSYPCCNLSKYRFQPVQSGPNGCQSREHKVKLKTELDKAIFKLLMTHRDAICLSSIGRSKIRIPADINSVCVPKPLSSGSNPVTVIVGEENGQEFNLVPKTKPRFLLNRSIWQVKKMPPVPTKPLIKKSLSSLSLNSSSPTAKLAAQRWKTITYGRLKRTPKLPVRQIPSSDSSSSTDVSEDSSGLDEDENGLEYDLERKNDLSIEIKIAHDDDKISNSGCGPEGQMGGSSLNLAISGSNSKFLSPGRPGSGTSRGQSRPSSPRRRNEKTAEEHWMKWDCDRSTRANQDNQRELECVAMRELMRHLSRTKGTQDKLFAKPEFSTPLGSSMTNRTWTNLQMVQFGGTFLKLEQDWRETHMAYLQHRSQRITTPSGLRAVTGITRDVRPHSAASLRNGRTYRR